MSVLHCLQAVPLEVNLAIEVHFVEGLHWNLVLAMVFRPITFSVEGEVVLNWTTRKFCFFRLARRDSRGDTPEDHENRDGCEEREEQGSPKPSTDLTCGVPRCNDEETNEEIVVECLATRGVCW